MTEAFINYYENELTVACGTGDSTIHVASTTPLPNDGSTFRLLIDAEIMIADGAAGGVITISTRGAEGTTAAAHENGAAVVNILTAGAVGNISGGGGGSSFTTQNLSCSGGGFFNVTADNNPNALVLYGASADFLLTFASGDDTGSNIVLYNSNAFNCYVQGPEDANPVGVIGPGATAVWSQPGLGTDSPGSILSQYAASILQDCTAGGVIDYAGPVPPPALIILSGTPGSEFLYQLPDGNYNTSILNLSGSVALVGGSTNPGTWPVLPTSNGSGAMMFTSFPLSGTWYSFPMTGWTPLGLPVNVTDATLESFGIITGLSIWRIASFNVSHGGSIPVMSVYGAAMNYLDSPTYSVTPPTIGFGPSPLSPTYAGSTTWEQEFIGALPDLTNGMSSVHQSGAGGILVAPAYYNNVNAYSTQAQFTGKGKFGDTCTGPSTGTAFSFNIANDFAVPYSVFSATVRVMARVVSTSGFTESVGDFFTTTFEAVWTNVNGFTNYTAATTGNPWVFSTASMSGCSATEAQGSSGPTWAEVEFQTSGSLDPSTVVDVQIIVEGDYL